MPFVTCPASDARRPVRSGVEQHEDRLLERLLDVGRPLLEPPVPFLSSDQAVVWPTRYRGELEPFLRFLLASWDLVVDSSDEQRFRALSRRLALPDPATRVAVDAGASAERHHDLGPFPSNVKPPLRSKARSSTESAQAVRVDDPADPGAFTVRFQEPEQCFCVHQCVRGPESATECYRVDVDSVGAVRAECSGRRIRTWSAEFGRSMALTLTAAVRDLGRSLVEPIGPRGVVDVDFRRSPHGDLYLLEINAPCSLCHHMGARLGDTIPAMVYAHPARTRGESRPTDRAIHATWVHPEAVLAARRAGVPWLRWLAGAAHADVEAFSVWNGPLLLSVVSGGWIGEPVTTAGRRAVGA